MAVGRIVLHVGPPRTGSTCIQAALSRCRARLLEHGVYYPATLPESDEGQPSLAWDILAECDKPVARLAQTNVSWDEALQGAERAGAQTLLVSSEDFASEAFDRTAFVRLRRHLGSLPVEVVFALRDPRRIIPSIWSHSVAWGIGGGEELLPLPEAVPLLMCRPNVRVSDYVITLEDTLQPARISFLTVPRRTDPAVLLKRFTDACELGPAVTDAIVAACDPTDRSENSALPLRQVLALLAVNRATPHPPEGSAAALDAHSIAIEVRRRQLDLLRKETAGRKPARAVLPPEFREEAKDLGRRIVRWTEGRGFPVYGDLRDVWDENADFADALDYSAAPVTDAEINESALSNMAETATELQHTIAEMEKAREFWRDQASRWEQLCAEITASRSWKVTKPLRAAGSFPSKFKRPHNA